MVRWYILPNPDHLEEDEVDFEIALRNIFVDGRTKFDDKKRELRRAYKNERKEPQKYESGLNVAEEIKIVEVKVEAVLRRLKREFNYADVSKIRHYLARISAAEANNEEEEALQQTCVEKLEEFLRTLKQRVTYDPECPSDETDSEARDAKSTTGDDSKQDEKDERKRQIQEMQQRFSKLDLGESSRKGKKIEKSPRKFERSPRSYDRDEKRRERERRRESTSSEDSEFEGKRNRRSKYRSDSDSSYRGSEYEQKRNRRSSRKRYRHRARSSSSEDERDRSQERKHYRKRYTSSSSADYRRRDRFSNRRSKVENWDIYFSGDSRSMQVEDFLNRVKKLAKHERVDEAELLDRIHYKLKGEASDWWFTREHRCTSWRRFESEILFRFGNPNRDRGIRQQIRELKQRKGETFVAFVTEIEKLDQCLQKSFRSREIFEIVWENMRPHYRAKLATINVKNLNHLLDLNRRIDANDPNLYRPSHSSRNEIHAIKTELESENEYSSAEEATVNFLQKKPKDRTNKQVEITQRTETVTAKCWNCQKPGHHWRFCKEPKIIFCYACGNVGRTTKTCERNHPQQQIPSQSNARAEN